MRTLIIIVIVIIVRIVNLVITVIILRILIINDVVIRVLLIKEVTGIRIRASLRVPRISSTDNLTVETDSLRTKESVMIL